MHATREGAPVVGPGTDNTGVVYHGAGIRWIDTRAMPWERWSVAEGYPRHRKLLAADADGHWLVMMLYLEPTFTDIIPEGIPYRNIHKRIHELTFVLEGSLPTVEYAAPDSDGVPLLSRPGWFMDRAPGSIHGHIADHHSTTGAVLLFFANSLGLGPLEGNWVGEPSYESESEDVPFSVRPDMATGHGLQEVPLEHRAVGADGILLDEGNVRRIDTVVKAWEPWPGMPGCARKILKVDDRGDAAVALLYLPPDVPASLASVPFRHAHSSVTEYGMVLEGELPVTEYADGDDREGVQLLAKRGWFFARQPGSVHGLGQGQTSVTGSVMLYWRTGPGTWPGEPGYEAETEEVAWK